MDNLIHYSYPVARELIRNGDLITFIKNERSSLWHQFTTAVTKSSYYHCGIAIWMVSSNGESRLFICEAGNRRRLLLLSTYQDWDFDVISSPVRFDSIESSLLSRVGVEPYSILTYIRIGLRHLFGLPFRDASGEICSEMIQREYKRAGLSYLPEDVLSPGELHDALLDNGCVQKFIVKGKP